MTQHNVLIIDKDSQALFAVSRILEKTGFNVTMAISGISGMEFIKSSSFSLILSEVFLDDADGLSILEAARNATPDTMVVFQTAANDPVLREKAFRLGADDYLFKPYQSEELLFRVKKCIENREIRRRLKRRNSYVIGCCVCKKFRIDGDGTGRSKWVEIEDFMNTEMNIPLSSTYCPECARSVQEELMIHIDRLKASKTG